MRYRIVLLVVALCVPVCGIRAQENKDQDKKAQPPPVCANIPEVDTDSKAYNDGYYYGYKDGCQHAFDAQQRKYSVDSGMDADRLAEPGPDSAPVKYVPLLSVQRGTVEAEGKDLLYVLKSYCKSKNRGYSDDSQSTPLATLSHRINMLMEVVNDPAKCK